MGHYSYSFAYAEDIPHPVKGYLELAEPLPYQDKNGGSGFYRQGKLVLDEGKGLDLVLYHNAATARFIYLRNNRLDKYLLEIIGLDAGEIPDLDSLVLPGQLCLGAERSRLIGEATTSIIGSPVFEATFRNHCQENLATFPIAREGLKYHVPDAIYENFGYYVDEVVLDAHHVFDSSVPVYNRSVELTLFKDKDLERSQKENIKVAFLADSIASGLVMKEVIARVNERFENLHQVEVVAPLATIRGLCRIAQRLNAQDLQVRVHVFETLLNALPPDYYYSAHFNIPELHIRPDLEEEYRLWWGTNSEGKMIADTACAGYGWSEVFYSPRKQIQMMNSQLESRHHLTIADLVKRNIRQQVDALEKAL